MSETPLYSWHHKAGAYLVDFAGWQMPLHYGSQIEEHHQVRRTAGLFDVSHMGVVDIEGADATYFLRYVLANDVQKLRVGSALYSCLLNETGGVIDDLIVYRLENQRYRAVINAATRNKDLAWLEKHSEQFDIMITERTDMAVLALQGPQALAIASSVLESAVMERVKALKPFEFVMQDNDSVLIAKTGYTGEEGLEMIVPADRVVKLWKRFIAQGAKPCGLGARDTLRLEAGFNLYGSDMDETTSPLVSNLAWTVAWQDSEREFIGRKALEKEKKQGAQKQLVGLVMEHPGVLRNHQTIQIEGDGEGEITSGGFSPTLGYAIALARIPITGSKQGRVERRHQFIPVKIVKPPFVRHGQKVYQE